MVDKNSVDSFTPGVEIAVIRDMEGGILLVCSASGKYDIMMIVRMVLMMIVRMISTMILLILMILMNCLFVLFLKNLSSNQ